jgi:hypothetical protein
MTLTLERQAAPSVRHDLHVDRDDIRFWNSAPEVVEIEFTVRNEGWERSAPTEATIQAAPLGAFVAWQTLGRVPVPAIEPRDEVIVRTRATCDPPPTGVRPTLRKLARLLTARDLFDRRPEKRPAPGALGTLPIDPLREMTGGSVHWAGNLNIFVGGKPTERHMAMSLRVRPGRLNMALFCVGNGSDAYRFHLEGNAVAWDARLSDWPELGMLTRRDRSAREIPIGEWVSGADLAVAVLYCEPPADCEAGKLDVHVEQKSTGKEAVVEFGFDPRAKGPGCYTL